MDSSDNARATDSSITDRYSESISREPFGPRLRRAVLILAAAIVAHLWLVRAPQVDGPLSRPPLALSQLMAQSGLAGAPRFAAKERLAASPARLVQVRTEFINVRLPLEPYNTALRTARRAPDLPVATSGFVRARSDVTPQHPRETNAASERLSDSATDTVQLSEMVSPRQGPAEDAEPTETAAALAPSVRPEAGPSALDSSTAATIAAATDRTAELRKQEDIVRKVLLDYTRAFERLDVQAAKAIYPSVDGRKLQRAFQQLDGQQVRFADCGVSVSGQDANARCRGDATYRPKVGSRVVRLTEREWTFNLARDNDRWQIVNATLQ